MSLAPASHTDKRSPVRFRNRQSATRTMGTISALKRKAFEKHQTGCAIEKTTWRTGILPAVSRFKGARAVSRCVSTDAGPSGEVRGGERDGGGNKVKRRRKITGSERGGARWEGEERSSRAGTGLASSNAPPYRRQRLFNQT